MVLEKTSGLINWNEEGGEIKEGSIVRRLAEAALEYAAMGWAVFPCYQPDGKRTGKEPANGHGFKEATTDKATITKLWNEKPYNIGISGGEMSGGLLIIDIDQKPDQGKFGLDWFRDWEEENGHLPDTVMAISGGGGKHLYYKYDPSKESFQKSENKIIHIDIRADGSYIIAPPSLHQNGNRYEWECGYAPDEIEIAEVNDLVRQLVRDVQPDKDEGSGEKISLDDEALKAELATIDDGRAAKLISLAGALIGKYKGVMPLAAYQETLRTWNSWFKVPIGSRNDDKPDKFEKCVLPCAERFLKRAKAEPDIDWVEARQLWCRNNPGVIFDATKQQWDEAKKLYLEAEKIEKGYQETRGASGQQFKAFKKFETNHANEFDNLPDFPIESFPEVLRSYAEQVAETAQVDVAMTGTFALATVAAACMGVFKVQAKPENSDFVQPLNLYSLVCAYPSERKTEAQRHFWGAVQGYEVAWNEKYQDEIKESHNNKSLIAKSINKLQEELTKPQNGKKQDRSALKAELAERQNDLKNLVMVEPIRLVLSGDITPEALTEVLKNNNGRIFIMSDEKDLIDSASGQYSKGNKPNATLLLKAYSGERHTVDRITRAPITLSETNICIAICIQPRPLANLMQEGLLKGTGFFERFLFCYPKSKIGHRNLDASGIDPTSKNNFTALIRKLYDLQTGEEKPLPNIGAEESSPDKVLLDWEDGINEPDKKRAVIIQMSEEGRNLSRAYEQKVEEALADAKAGNEQDIMGWIGKEFGTAMRIAALFHIVEHRDRAALEAISAQNVERAISIMAYYRANAAAIFEAYGTDNRDDALYVWTVISKAAGEDMKVSFQTVYQKCKHRFKKREEIDKPISELTERGYIRVEKATEGAGRPSETIVINPEAKEQL